MNLRSLNRATLARQGLLERSDTPAVAMVEQLAGMQAQEPKPPFVGLWSRTEGFDADQLRRALRRGLVVRATLMRATLHLMSARDFRAFRATLQPALDASMASILKARGEGIAVNDVLAAARKVLEGEQLTFDEIRAVLAERFPDVDRRALGYVARTGLPLVMVPTGDPWGYARDSRFELAGKVDSGASDDELVRRYLAAFGPATPADMQAWSGLKGLKQVFARLDLEEVDKGLYDVPGAPRPDSGTPAPVRFLPAFDSLLLAHRDRTRIIAGEHRPKVVTKNLRIHPTFLVDGFAAGMWSVKATKRKATLTLEPFGKLARAAQNELVEEADALLRFSEPGLVDYAVVIAS